MRPPICALCRRDFRGESGGGLVHFCDAESLPEGRVGHPRGVEWFCDRHLPAARELSNSTLAEAMRQLRRRYGWRLKLWLAERMRWRNRAP